MQHQLLPGLRGTTLSPNPALDIRRRPAGPGCGCGFAGSGRGFAGSSRARLRRQQLRVSAGLSSQRSTWPLQNRLSDLRHRTEDVLHTISTAVLTSPPARLLDTAWQPVAGEVQRQYGRFVNVYAGFTSEETKRKWKWSRQMDQERRFWVKCLKFWAVMFATVVYESLVPVSIVLGLAVPLVYQWAMYERPVMNPVTVAMLLILPYKFCPGAAWRWL